MKLKWRSVALHSHSNLYTLSFGLNINEMCPQSSLYFLSTWQATAKDDVSNWLCKEALGGIAPSLQLLWPLSIIKSMWMIFMSWQCLLGLDKTMMTMWSSDTQVDPQSTRFCAKRHLLDENIIDELIHSFSRQRHVSCLSFFSVVSLWLL